MLGFGFHRLHGSIQVSRPNSRREGAQFSHGAAFNSFLSRPGGGPVVYGAGFAYAGKTPL
jgi:hypothetical protein